MYASPVKQANTNSVADMFKTLGCKLLIHHLLQVIFREEASVNTLHRDFIAVEWINENQSGADSFVDYLLKRTSYTCGGILAVTILSTQEELQVHYELVFDFPQRDVSDIVLLLHELYHTAIHSLVLLIGRIGFAYANEFFVSSRC